MLRNQKIVQRILFAHPLLCEVNNIAEKEERGKR